MMQTIMQQVARDRANKVLEFLDGRGIKASLVGSINSDQFGVWSDVDFLVTECPKHLKYSLESRVEDLMGDFKFDVVYADETPAHVLRKMATSAPSKSTNG